MPACKRREATSLAAQKPALKWSPAPVVILGLSVNGPSDHHAPSLVAHAAESTG